MTGLLKRSDRNYRQMGFGEILYRILIGPLELLFEVIFVIADRHVDNPAYAIVFLSLAMNFLVLPLYRRADAVQAEERDRENALAPWIKHIKKTFKGDERFMMLQAYYRENNYKPTDSLKGSVSLLLEIPFFIAAYHFLSNLQVIRGVSFGPITDLGAPDGLLTIGSVTLNLLPILMTLINVISAAIYMKGFPLKSKIQMYGIAAIFLVLLYNSPAGLVFYWTLNNIFSLLKNIFYKLPNPAKVLKILASAVGVVLLVVVLFVHPMPTVRAQAIVIALLLCLQIPLLKGNRKLKIISVDSKDSSKVFYASAIFMTLLTGLLIPSAVIADSTEEFLSITSYYSPYWHIVSALAIAFGTFIVWFTIFYRLASEEGKQLFSGLMAVIAVSAAVNYMFFGNNYGNISSSLVYDATPVIKTTSMLLNIAVLLLVAAEVLIIFVKKLPIIKAAIFAMCAALIIMSGMNIVQIRKDLIEASPIIETATKSEPEINLSKDGKNVVVIMMDRQVGHFVPFMMHEKPELKEAFSGFTYYANSFSYGTVTNVGSPGIYGGYEYIPAEMNKRDGELLKDKHNEALKVMPKMFLDEGCDVTVLQPTYAGYTWIPDLSIYDDMPEVKTAITEGRFSLPEYNYETDDESAKALRKRNFFLYGIFKSSPLLLQPTIYAKGSYNKPQEEVEVGEQVVADMYKAEVMPSNFLAQYAVLCNLPSFTEVKKSDVNTFTMMSNDTTHEETLLQEPDYVPAEKVDNSDIGEGYTHKEDDEGNTMDLVDEKGVKHYEVNMAAMLKLGEWLDYLKKEGVYDNTRIIIVSDHGSGIEDNVMPVIEYTAESGEKKIIHASSFDCVLLAKDFGAKEFTTSDELIANAETPAIATDEMVSDATNPFTGKKISRFKDQKGEPELIHTKHWQTRKNNGNTFLPGEWFTVQNNIYEKNNWKHIGYR